MFNVVLTDEFIAWINELTPQERTKVLASLELLREHGHHLSRPFADTIKNSHLTNLKELRIQYAGKPYRAFFVFDPLRQAVILCGGNKTGDKRFYKRMIPLAEKIYANYLQEHQLEQ